MSFTFAWVDSTDDTFLPAFEREDEQVFGFEISHVEGDFPALRIEIKNPRVGFLSGGRKQWAWLGYDDGGSSGVKPLFFGRLIGSPEQVQDEVVALSFIARPTDWESQRAALAETLKVAPFWDPVWVAEERRDDPDAVLDARPALWHIDRVTHLVTASDIGQGEDGTISVGVDKAFRDSLDIYHSEPPLRSVSMTAHVYWEQSAAGSIDIKKQIIAAAKATGSVWKGSIETYTGDGLARDWPEEGDRIGAGWSVGESYVTRGDGVWAPEDYERKVVAYKLRGLYQPYIIDFQRWIFNPVMHVAYDVSRSRSEVVRFTLTADAQALVTDPGDQETLDLELSSRDVGEPIDPPFDSSGEGDIPIGDLRRRAYFTTDRGKQSLAYLIAYCRTRLLARARAVEVRFEMPFDDGLDLSCRKSVTLTDARIPGGSCTGKIIAYRLALDGDSGQAYAAVTIACMIGKGNTVTGATGTPDYVEEGYVEPGYQTYTGAQLSVVAGEVTYEDYSSVQPNDDGIDFLTLDADTAIVSLQMINGRSDQENLLRSLPPNVGYNPGDIVQALNDAHTQIRLELVPLTGGPFETEYDVTVSQLMIPKTIDLEAS